MTSTEYFRATGSSAAPEVRRLISHEPADIAACEPVAMEILCGATDVDTSIKLGRLVNGLSSLGVDNSLDFRAAADGYRAARRTGETIRSVNDCLVAAIAIRHGVAIAHCDRDFDVIAGITSLVAASFASR